MRLCIDAWLERRDPRISLIDASTGKEFVRLGSEQIRELMESGDLCIDDLKNASYPCIELLALLKERMVLQRDPTYLRMPSYMGCLKMASPIT
jgi:hypothetical protein